MNASGSKLLTASWVVLLFGCLAQAALHKKSWAVIDRPYSLGCATVGALYERPRCIFCAKPAQADVGAEDVTDLLSLFVDKSSKHKVFFTTALHRELRCVE